MRLRGPRRAERRGRETFEQDVAVAVKDGKRQLGGTRAELEGSAIVLALELMKMRHQRNPRHHRSPSEKPLVFNAKDAGSRTRIGNAFVNCGENTRGVKMKRSKRPSISEALCPCIGSAKQMKSRANPIMRRDPQKEMGNIFGSRAMKRRACLRFFAGTEEGN